MQCGLIYNLPMEGLDKPPSPSNFLYSFDNDKLKDVLEELDNFDTNELTEGDRKRLAIVADLISKLHNQTDNQRLDILFSFYEIMMFTPLCDSFYRIDLTPGKLTKNMIGSGEYTTQDLIETDEAISENLNTFIDNYSTYLELTKRPLIDQLCARYYRFFLLLKNAIKTGIEINSFEEFKFLIQEAN